MQMEHYEKESRVLIKKNTTILGLHSENAQSQHHFSRLGGCERDSFLSERIFQSGS